MTTATLEPVLETDGSRWTGAWKLILEWDNDISEWTITGQSAGGVRLELELTDDELHPIRELFA